MKKKVLMGLVLLAITGTMVFAQAPTLDKLKFTGTQGGTLSPGAINQRISGSVVIPAAYDGKPVTNILANAFLSCTGITSVTIPNSVSNFATGVFDGCTALTSVTFQGTIPRNNLPANNFPGDLIAKWLTGGPGTYTRQPGSDTWTKGGRTICPHCNGTGFLD